MEFDNKMIRLTVAVLLFLASTSIITKNNNMELAQGKVDDIILDIGEAFDKAEDDVLNIDPKPKPDPKPLGPDPDPDKCVCGGTGVITHGDGHTTDCPYHKQTDQTKSCKQDCKGECDKDCNCANNSGCIVQVSHSKETAVKKEYQYQLHVFGGGFCSPCKQMDQDVWQNLVDPNKYGQDSHKSMKKFLHENSIQFIKHMWEDTEDRKAFTKNNVSVLPTIILIKDEKVIMRIRGYSNKNSIRLLINNKISKGR